MEDMLRFHKKLSNKTKILLPLISSNDSKLYLRFAKYLCEVYDQVKDSATELEKLRIFLEANYKGENEKTKNIGTVFKAGWGRKKIGGRYKNGSILNFVKSLLE